MRPTASPLQLLRQVNRYTSASVRMVRQSGSSSSRSSRYRPCARQHAILSAASCGGSLIEYGQSAGSFIDDLRNRNLSPTLCSGLDIQDGRELSADSQTKRNVANGWPGSAGDLRRSAQIGRTVLDSLKLLVRKD